jgi:hypothetical protein
MASRFECRYVVVLNKFLLPSSVLEFYYVYDGVAALDTVPSRLYWLAGLSAGSCVQGGDLASDFTVLDADIGGGRWRETDYESSQVLREVMQDNPTDPLQPTPKGPERLQDAQPDPQARVPTWPQVALRPTLTTTSRGLRTTKNAHRDAVSLAFAARRLPSQGRRLDVERRVRFSQFSNFVVGGRHGVVVGCELAVEVDFVGRRRGGNRSCVVLVFRLGSKRGTRRCRGCAGRSPTVSSLLLVLKLPVDKFGCRKGFGNTNRVVDIVRERTREPCVDCFHQWVFVFGVETEV